MIGLSLGPSVMMQLGAFQFSISTAAYQELTRRSEYRWASQDRFGKQPNLQYTGPASEAISLVGVIYPDYKGGGGQLDKMRQLAGGGQPLQGLLGIDHAGGVVGGVYDDGLGVFIHEGFERGKVYLEAHAPLDDSGDASVVDKHTAVINALLKNDAFADLRLDWEMLREVVAAEDGLPVEIAQPDQAVVASEPAI